MHPKTEFQHDLLMGVERTAGSDLATEPKEIFFGAMAEDASVFRIPGKSL
jgi:hypothetical protein